MTNTIETATADRTHARKDGDFGATGAKASNSSPRISSGVIDQYGQHWVEVNHYKANCWVKTVDLASGGSKASALLDRAGIVQITTSSLRALAVAAEAWANFSKGMVIDRPGWQNSVYVHGSSRPISVTDDESTFINAVVPIEKFKIKGTTKSWLKAFTPLLMGQDVLLVALGYGYLGAASRCP